MSELSMMPDGNMSNCTCMPMSMTMQMTFTGGIDVAILFQFWTVTNAWEMALSWFGVFFLSVGYELLKTMRDRISTRMAKRSYFQIQKTEDNSEAGAFRFGQLDAMKLTLLQVVIFSLAYLLMLIVMTYNVYLFVAVVLGDALGYYVTLNMRPAQLLTSTGGEHCH